MPSFLRLTKEQLTFLKLISFFTLIGQFFRLVFYFMFGELIGDSVEFSQIKEAFLLGLRFDLRFAAFVSLPIWFLGYVFKIVNYIFSSKDDPMFINQSRHATLSLTAIYSLAATAYTLLFIIDLGHFDYLKNRLDAAATIFLKNFSISYEMLTQSYPVALILLGLLAVLILYFFALKKTVFKKEIFLTHNSFFKSNVFGFVFVLLSTAFFIHGKLSQYPLRWSEAYFTNDSVLSALALNPALYFYDTLDFKNEKYNLEKVKEHYDLVADYLKVDSPNKKTLNFDRQIKPFMEFDKKPHIVVIMMESLASFKLSHFHQKMNGTPFLDSLIPQSLFYENFYVTSTGTARSIFGMLTGLPDVNSVQTASRNPLIVNQYSAANGLKDYNKTYLIGGSANWGNIRGFVGKSIENINILEEGDFKSSKNDVWGISDLQLFKEANRLLKEKTSKSDQLQFTFIQTAGYHRPYTIPKDRGDFQIENLTEKEIKENGFVSNEEFNSLRFSDYALGEFFKAAKKEKYFQNSLFVIYADHGLAHFYSKDVPKGIKHHRLPIMHVPLLFYSPALKKKPEVVSKLAYQSDVMPSILSLTGHSYVNKSLGRNLFDPKYDDKRYALTISRHSTPLEMRIHDNKWISTGSPDNVQGLYPYKDESKFQKDQALFSDENKEEEIYRKKLSEGLYHTIKYLYFHAVKK